jgi:hypothetical protein
VLPTLPWLVACSHAAATRVGATASDAAVIPPNGAVLPLGTRLDVRFADPLVPRLVKDGDRFTMTTLALRAQNGDEAVPAGGSLYGHVTEVTRPAAGDSTTLVRVEFDSLAFAGHTHPFFAYVVAIAAPVGAVERRGVVAATSRDISPASGAAIAIGPGASPQIPRGTTLTVETALTIDLR